MATALIQRTAGRLPAIAHQPPPGSSTRRSAMLLRQLHAEAEAGQKQGVETLRFSASVLQVRSFASMEGEDGKITGVTRSLARRVLALNIGGTLRADRTLAVRELGERTGDAVGLRTAH